MVLNNNIVNYVNTHFLGVAFHFTSTSARAKIDRSLCGPPKVHRKTKVLIVHTLAKDCQQRKGRNDENVDMLAKLGLSHAKVENDTQKIRTRELGFKVIRGHDTEILKIKQKKGPESYCGTAIRE